jgi:hypothetical protein
MHHVLMLCCVRKLPCKFQLFWLKRFQNILSNIDNSKTNGFPLCCPTWPPGSINWINLNLHYVRKLSCKSQLFLLSSSWKDFTLFLYFCDYPPLKKTWSFLWTNWNFLCPWMIHTKFNQNWPAGSGEDFWKFFSVFLPFLLLSPLEQKTSVPIHFNKFESPPPMDVYL